jgi:uncharacterized membrane protein
MAENEPESTGRHMEVILAYLLRTGVILSAVVVAVGGLAFLIRHGGEAPQYHAFHSEPAGLRSLSGIVADALALSSRGWIQLGLILLILTPIARVAFSVFAFARQRDRAYVVVTLIVLALLLYSLAGG